MIRGILVAALIIGGLIYIANNPAIGGVIGHDVHGLFAAAGAFLSSSTHG